MQTGRHGTEPLVLRAADACERCSIGYPDRAQRRARSRLGPWASSLEVAPLFADQPDQVGEPFEYGFRAQP